MIFIENEYIKAGFASKGAELQQLISKDTQQNYMWEGDPAFWGKYSPVLFPIVGGLRDNTYLFEGHTYQMGRHGFARDNEFSFHKISSSEIIFLLNSSEQTIASYPFEFELSLRYRISAKRISCTYEVFNPSSGKDLLFSIGGHPAFALPTNNRLFYDDYTLEFNKDETLVYHKIHQDLISEETISIPLKEHKLSLQHKLFYEDALVIKTLKSDCITLRNSKNSSGLSFSFSGFPYFGIWAAKNADFVCLEPWCGIADVEGHNQNLIRKEGINYLSPEGKWERTWSIDIF